MNPAESLQLGALYDALRTPAPMPADPAQLNCDACRTDAAERSAHSPSRRRTAAAIDDGDPGSK